MLETLVKVVGPGPRLMRMGSGLGLVRGSPEGRAMRQEQQGSLFSNQKRSKSKWGKCYGRTSPSWLMTAGLWPGLPCLAPEETARPAGTTTEVGKANPEALERADWEPCVCSWRKALVSGYFRVIG